MIIDTRTEFCDAVDISAVAGTALVGSQIDLGAAPRDIGNGRPVYLIITVDVAIITGGNAGLIRFKLASDDTATISTTTSTVHLQTGEYVTDDTGTYSVGGTTGVQAALGDVLFCGALPNDGENPYERYLGLLCTITTTTVTVGRISAFLSLIPKGNKIYPNQV